MKETRREAVPGGRKHKLMLTLSDDELRILTQLSWMIRGTRTQAVMDAIIVYHRMIDKAHAARPVP